MAVHSCLPHLSHKQAVACPQDLDRLSAVSAGPQQVCSLGCFVVVLWPLRRRSALAVTTAPEGHKKLGLKHFGRCLHNVTSKHAVHMTRPGQMELDTAVCLCTDVCSKQKSRRKPTLEQRLTGERKRFLIVCPVSARSNAPVHILRCDPLSWYSNRKGFAECVIIALSLINAARYRTERLFAVSGRQEINYKGRLDAWNGWFWCEKFECIASMGTVVPSDIKRSRHIIAYIMFILRRQHTALCACWEWKCFCHPSSLSPSFLSLSLSPTHCKRSQYLIPEIFLLARFKGALLVYLLHAISKCQHRAVFISGRIDR